MKIRVMSIFGTRPEAIKMCPLVKELGKHEEIENIVCLTGQHREMLQQVIDIFGTDVKYNLDIMQPQQTLTTITTSILDLYMETHPHRLLLLWQLSTEKFRLGMWRLDYVLLINIHPSPKK